MAYCGYEELKFAHGYFHIGFAGNGIVTLDDDTPEEIRRRFWEAWPSFHKKVVERQKKGIFSSAYPVLPFEDPVENRRNYETGNSAGG